MLPIASRLLARSLEVWDWYGSHEGIDDNCLSQEGPKRGQSCPFPAKFLCHRSQCSCLSSAPFLTSSLFQGRMCPQISSMLGLRYPPLPQPTALPAYRTHPLSCVLLLRSNSLSDHCQLTFSQLPSLNHKAACFLPTQCPVKTPRCSGRPASLLLSGHCTPCLLSGLTTLSAPAW